MKKIGDYRKLLDVTRTATLQELKTVYRNCMKDWHPDKFQEDDARKLEAEEKSKALIEAYHFLVSIAPETKTLSLPEYNQTISSSSIVDFEFKSQVLQITFLDGSVYEYFDVPHNTYTKLVNAESRGRFARRHIYNEFVYRNVTRATAPLEHA
jgi:curved DNA-binding protein CbpA